MRSKDLAIAHVLAAGSTLIHAVPALHKPARRLLNLEHADSVLLRWRVAPHLQSNDTWAATQDWTGNATNHIKTWPYGMLAVANEDMHSDGREAVAYMAGSVCMVGVREIGGSDFLVPDGGWLPPRWRSRRRHSLPNGRRPRTRRR